MAKQIMQFRYYGDSNTSNQPAKVKGSAYRTGAIFEDYYPITYLRIQGPENIEFFINGSTTSVMLGESDYELDVNNLAEINKLQFGKSISEIGKSNSNSLIIDIIYEKR